jgi:hypothetical protein
MFFAHSGGAVNQALDWPQREIQESSLAIEHPGHEDAEWLGYGQDHQQEKNNLQPAIRSHGSELFRLEQRRKQIAQQENANEKEQNVLKHRQASLEPFASAEVYNSGGKKS